MHIAMKLREVMVMNGILYNSEAWHGVNQSYVKTLQAIDNDLLRKFLKHEAKHKKKFCICKQEHQQ